MKISIRNSILIGVFAGLFSFTAAVSARSPSGATGQQKQAKSLYAEGKKLFAKGEYKRAIESFKKAYSHWDNWKILINIAICYAEIPEAAHAVSFLRLALKKMPAALVPVVQKKLPPALVKAQTQVAVLTVVMPDPTAVISIDGKAAGSSPLERVLMPGTYTITVTLGETVKARKVLTVAPGSQERFALEQWPALERPNLGGVTPAPTPSKPRRKLGRLSLYYFSSAAAVALVSAVAMIATGVKTNQIKDDYFADPNLDTRDRGVRYRTATNVLLGVTVTAAVAAGVLAVFTDWRLPWKREGATQTTIAPQLGPTGIGVTVGGAF